MSYTVIWFAKHQPEEASKTLHISRAVLWGALALVFVGMPALFFTLGAIDASPEAVRQRLEAQTLEFATLSQTAMKTDKELTELKERFEKLQAEYLSETGRRAEVEARLEIVENARANALKRLDEAEKTQAEMTDKLTMFKDIFKPTEDAIPIQCYNIEADERKDGVRYSMALMKTDNKDDEKVDLELQMRVLTGSSIASLGEAATDKADRTRTASLIRQVDVSGIIRGDFPKKGMRVLDVRGYDSKGEKLLTHCWKVF